jgi:hypothetical protein
LKQNQNLMSQVGTLWLALPGSNTWVKLDPQKNNYHVSRGSGSCLPVGESSDAVTCPVALDLASLLGRAPVLSRIPRLWILPQCSGGHQCYHVSHDTGPRLPAREGSSTVTCPAALDPVSLLGRATALSRVRRHRTSPPWSGGLRRCHMSHGSMWITGLKHKEKPSSPACAVRHACFQRTRVSFQGA